MRLQTAKNKKNTLADINPDLAKEWHPTKNEPLTPGNVIYGSGKKVWWICRKGHAWEAVINDRKRGRGCPYCSGRRVNRDNCLQTVNSKLAKQWHPTKNAPLTPKDVISGSGKKAWWRCGKGHEWEAVIYGRNKGVDCPYCSGYKACEENCLQTVDPKIARQWHPTKNFPLTPKEVTAGSEKKVWWLCQKGHEWEATIYDRKRGGRCPYCSGRRVNRDNCLQTVNPKLAREWHPTRNGQLTAMDVTPRYNKKVWWKCGKGHEWQTRVSHRNNGSGCPYCSGQKVCKDNCLQTVNPKLAKEWHPTKNAPLRPTDVTGGSNKKIWWKCRKGHEWQATAATRKKGFGCAYCSGHKVSKDNCLQTVQPWLARQWHPTRNVSLTPRNVTPVSKRNVWWRCRNGHEWQEIIAYRTSKRKVCPVCILKEKYPHFFRKNNKQVERAV